MKLKLLLLIPVCVAALIAQNANPDPKQPGPTQVTKVVRVHGDAFSISNLLGKSGTVEHLATSALRAIVLKGPAPDVDNVEHTIQELDSLGSTSGPKGVELTACCDCWFDGANFRYSRCVERVAQFGYEATASRSSRIRAIRS